MHFLRVFKYKDDVTINVFHLIKSLLEDGLSGSDCLCNPLEIQFLILLSKSYFSLRKTSRVRLKSKKQNITGLKTVLGSLKYKTIEMN